MRQYLDRNKNELQSVVCNQCGRELKVTNGMLMEGVFHGDVRWGYFSEKDGERHSFDLCEACYEKLRKGFRVPVTVEAQTELL
jgi:ribosomal-protein-alanine N-acetyltransferase